METCPLVGYVRFRKGVYNFEFLQDLCYMQCNQTWNQTFPTTGLLFGLWWEQSVHCFLWNSGHRRWNLWVTWLKLRIQDPNLYFVLFKWVKRCIALLEKQLYTCAVSRLFGVIEFLLLLLGQWLNFKLLWLTYFRVHWPSDFFFVSFHHKIGWFWFIQGPVTPAWIPCWTRWSLPIVRSSSTGRHPWSCWVRAPWKLPRWDGDLMEV